MRVIAACLSGLWPGHAPLTGPPGAGLPPPANPPPLSRPPPAGSLQPSRESRSPSRIFGGCHGPIYTPTHTHTHTHTHNQPRKKQRNKETKKGREIKMAPLPSCFFGAIYLLLLLLLFAGCDTLCVCVCLCYVRILYFCFRWLFRKHRQLPLLSPPPSLPPQSASMAAPPPICQIKESLLMSSACI